MKGENGDASLVPRAALVSVYDKTGIASLVKTLLDMGYIILATGGTYKTLCETFKKSKEYIRAIMSVEEYTGSPEILQGRVKTLHPKIYGGILARRGNKQDMDEIRENGIYPIDLVAGNLYPFEQTISQKNISINDAIEQIDIGGVTLLRAAAKNFSEVIVLGDPKDYERGVELLQEQGVTSTKDRENQTMLMTERLFYASKIFSLTAYYEATISQYMYHQARESLFLNNDFQENEAVLMESPLIALPFMKDKTLRYGENPHQKATLYKQSYPHVSKSSLFYAKKIHGKELSFNNIRDAEAAISLGKHFLKSKRFDGVCAIGIKHGNPCGVAVRDTAEQAWTTCYKADPVSIFGGVVALTKEVDEKTAILLSRVFLEIIIAPKFSVAAKKILTQKKNIRLLQVSFTSTSESRNSFKYGYKEPQFISISGGLLVQDLDRQGIYHKELRCVTKKSPTKSQLQSLLFAWDVCKYVKSNAIVLAKNKATTGIGAGQMSRVSAAEIAIAHAKKYNKIKDSVLASDAFLPMKDTVELAVKYKIKAIIQPGGSMRDKESIEECNTNDITMLFTGKRHFLH